jgi:iron complex outermembrane receptor protein
MSELVNARKTGMNFRRQLLATASAIALIGSLYGAGGAKAADDDSDRSSVWIELGGQLSRMSEGQEVFAPAFPDSPPRPSIFSPSQKFEGLPLYSIDETGKISFEPTGSDWVFSASVRYGRSGSNKRVIQQTHPASFIVTKSGHPSPSFAPAAPLAAHFADTRVQNDESHLIADFQAGKDLGIGMFGNRGSSVFNFGVRFAQFNSKSNISLKSDPDWHFSTKYFYGFKLPAYQPYHSNLAHMSAARNFRGIGPSLSWNGEAPIAGSSQISELSFDWGVNFAILFGRQRANVNHEETGRYHGKKYHAGYHVTLYHPTPVNVHRTKTVIVPNIGGFAGASWRIQNFKVSAGYRADLFFGAMDGGIDTAKKENVGFYGPFASVSVGLGG